MIRENTEVGIIDARYHRPITTEYPKSYCAVKYHVPVLPTADVGNVPHGPEDMSGPASSLRHRCAVLLPLAGLYSDCCYVPVLSSAVYSSAQQLLGHRWRSVSRVNCLGRTTVVLTIEERIFLVEHVLRNGDKYTENVQ
jgi:hypothetical protein